MSLNEEKPMRLKDWFKELAPYVVAVFLCAVCLNWAFKLWQADLRYPIQNDGDCPLCQVVVKNIIEHSATTASTVLVRLWAGHARFSAA